MKKSKLIVKLKSGQTDGRTNVWTLITTQILFLSLTDKELAVAHLVAEPGQHLGAVLLGVGEHGRGAVGAEPGPACSQNLVMIMSLLTVLTKL